VSVEDLSSKNGTFVGGNRIDGTTRLQPGDEIQIGPIKLIFRLIEGLGATQTEVWTHDSG
jgi:pSer/pThr/pTyr-binding forkhead associated (FHA) protein